MIFSILLIEEYFFISNSWGQKSQSTLHPITEVISIYPIPHEKPWWEDTRDNRRGPIKKLEGIMSQVAQMSNGDLRKFYGGYLVPYGYREEDIMSMPMDKLEYLFNTVMSI